MAKKQVKLQLDDDPPRVVNGKWLRVINDGEYGEFAKDVALIAIEKITALLTRDPRDGGGCIIDFGTDGRVYVKNYTPDQIVKLFVDAEFNEAVERTLIKGVG